MAPSPDKLIEALRKRRGPGGLEKGRRHPRHGWRVRLRLIVQEGSGEWGRRELTVTTCDISVGGFSFAIGQFLNPGTTVYARFDMLPNRPALKGIVRNCTHVEARVHRVGVEFVTLEPGGANPHAGKTGD